MMGNMAFFFLLAQKWMSVESSQTDQEKILKETDVWSDFEKCVSVKLKTFLFSHLIKFLILKCTKATGVE